MGKRRFWQEEGWEYVTPPWKFGYVMLVWVVAISLGVVAAIIGVREIERGSNESACSVYSQIAEVETVFIDLSWWEWDCFIKTDTGLLPYDEYIARTIDNLGGVPNE